MACFIAVRYEICSLTIPALYPAANVLALVLILNVVPLLRRHSWPSSIMNDAAYDEAEDSRGSRQI